MWHTHNRSYITMDGNADPSHRSAHVLARCPLKECMHGQPVYPRRNSILYRAVPPPAPQQASTQLLIRRSKKFDHKNYLRPNKIHEHVARAAADPATATAAANAATAANAAGSASRDLHAASIRIWSGRRSLRRARRQLPSSSADEKAYGAHAQVA